jgi:hypothetical protein
VPLVAALVETELEREDLNPKPQNPKPQNPQTLNKKIITRIYVLYRKEEVHI